ncbi:MAG: circadian clock KaiB family protein [Thermodesulfobacteriota bacterium]
MERAREPSFGYHGPWRDRGDLKDDHKSHEDLSRHLNDKCRITVINILRNLQLAKGDQIIAAPTLIKKLPLPLRRLIGDMSDTEKFLVGIDLKPKNS